MSRFPEAIINFVLAVIEILLGLRFIFRLFGANPSAAFARWLYAATDPLLAPFSNIFPIPVMQGVFVIEFITLVAIIIYMLIGYLILGLIRAVRTGITRE